MNFYRPVFNSEIEAPVSKSFVIRALLCAALSETPCEIVFSGSCRDIETAINILPLFGAQVKRNISSLTVIPSPVFPEKPCIIPDFGECAAVMRIYMPVIQSIWGDIPYKATDRLKERVRDTLLDTDAILNPCTEIDPSLSSQTLSGLMFEKELHGGKIKLLKPAVSTPYVAMTANILSTFTGRQYISIEDHGDRSFRRFQGTERYVAEGDWSAAAFPLVAGVIGMTPVSVRGLSMDSVQGDRAIITVLKNMGARIETDSKEGLITAYPSPLRPFSFDAQDFPDLVPPLCAAACAAEGVSVFHNIGRLKLKESDRIGTLCQILSEAGAYGEYKNGILYVSGPVHGGKLSAVNDHRITMTAILLSLISEYPIEIGNISSISKSYPGFAGSFTQSTI